MLMMKVAFVLAVFSLAVAAAIPLVKEPATKCTVDTSCGKFSEFIDTLLPTGG